MTNILLLGRRVRWRHIIDGKRTRDVEGMVVACELNREGQFILLLELDSGQFAQAQALDLECVPDQEEAVAPAPEPIKPAARPRRSLLAKDKPE